MEGMALGGDGQLEAITTVRVSHVPQHVTETEFNCWFIFAYGFEQATLGPPKSHGGRSGWARFGTVEAAQAAIQNLDGRQLTVHQSQTEAVLAAELAKKNFVSAKPTAAGQLAKRQRLGLDSSGAQPQYQYAAPEPGLEALPFDAQAAHQAAASVVQQFMQQPIEAQRQDASQVWQCPACGSHNPGNRPFCNTAICGLAKPGLTAQDVLGSVAMAGGGGGGDQQSSAHVAFPGDLGPAQGVQSWPDLSSEAAQPSWVHPPSTAQQPTAADAMSAEAPQGLTAFVGADSYGAAAAGFGMTQTATEMQMQMLGLDQSQLATIVGGLGAVGAEGAECMQEGAGGVNNPPGCWTCTTCFNTNWPTRSTCNGKRSGSVCGLHRSLSEGTGLPLNPPGAKLGATPPSGSWICTNCSNVNWPTRTTCNAKHCLRPREHCDGGEPRVVPPPAQPLPGGACAAAVAGPPQGPVPEGAWICAMCQNVNWPLRTHCNKRACGAPRMM